MVLTVRFGLAEYLGDPIVALKLEDSQPKRDEPIRNRASQRPGTDLQDA